ncbi:ABC transporter substrate-binding protein [Vibrio pelagius]|uniref:ABC transporter substrate-binding protein n=1 Tax=Vibrio pelagius TaxID=28169 RepID=UPI0021C38648|nr:extracellular solute-binding protein [Vibrio pelagius]
MFKRVLAAVAISSSLLATSAYADCGFTNETEVKSLSASFQAWKVITNEMQKCGNVSAELDNEFKIKQPAAFATQPSLYHIAGVSNETIQPLLNEKTIRPLDDLVAKYGQHLSPNQLIKVDGKIMAIAMMINSQHLIYRQDILDQLKIPTPTTYDEVLSAAKKIRDAGIMEYPLTGTYKTGWNLGMEFTNLYMSYGGQFFDESNQPMVNSEAGKQTLTTMKALTEYMDPEYLIADSTQVQKKLQQDKAAIANLWASRASAVDDEAESLVAGKIAFAAAPSAVPGGKPAATLWWDGMTIAANISDEEAEAAFRTAISTLTPEMANTNSTVATWLVKGYKPSKYSTGSIANAQSGTPAYPASVPMGMMQAALGTTVSNYLVGDTSLEQTLQEIESKYLTTAKESGLL